LQTGGQKKARRDTYFYNVASEKPPEMSYAALQTHKLAEMPSSEREYYGFLRKWYKF
jgi:hypothetical protein